MKVNTKKPLDAQHGVDEERALAGVYSGIQTTDGAGVALSRVIGSSELELLDPFLLLDRFASDRPDDYIAGFPAHPHRGFETVTYLLQGRMRHRDSTGREGVIESGGVQWMSAGRGVIHSEMPEQENGLLAGFQLWINLPAAHKMDRPAYQEFRAGEIPLESRKDGGSVRVIAGTTSRGTHGVVIQPLTEPVYLDVTLNAGARFSETLPVGHNAFVFVIDGEPTIGGHSVAAGQLAVFSRHGDGVVIEAGETATRFLLVAGKPLNEAVARGGPFVMNSAEEISRAFEDYKAGRLA